MRENLLKGVVISGQKIAHEFGVATANLEIFAGNLSEDGVYIVECFLPDKKSIKGVMHYGKRKTTDNKFSVEVHLLDFSREIYRENLEVNVLKKLRDISKFDSIENLFNQIKNDIIKTKKFFLRREIKNVWKNLSRKSREILANKALGKISTHTDFLNSENIYIYAPKGDEIEFVGELCQKFPEKNYFFPKIINGEMQFFRGIFVDLKVGKWGILEPSISSPAPQSINNNFIFVPAIAANFAGFRLGNGGGFYDKFLQNNSAKTICVLPEFAVFREIPTEDHDEKIGEIIVV